MSQLYLFARIAGTPIAVASGEVEAVVKLGDVSPVPGMPLHIAGLSALRSRVLTVIDAAALIRGSATPAAERSLAIVADIAGHSYGLMVDAVTDICAVADGEQSLRGTLDAAWRPHGQALINGPEGVSLLVSLASFIDPVPPARAA
jgi:purine-binding chemotaxis protein CheW